MVVSPQIPSSLNKKEFEKIFKTFFPSLTLFARKYVPDLDTAKEIASQLIRTGKVFKAYLGLMLQEVEIPIKSLRYFALHGARGLFISKIEKDSPASRSQLQEGDIMINFNGKRVETIYDLFKRLGNQDILKMVDVEVLRYDRKVVLSITPIQKAA